MEKNRFFKHLFVRGVGTLLISFGCCWVPYGARLAEAEIIKKTDSYTFEQDILRKGVFVTYRIVVTKAMRDREAEDLLSEKLIAARQQWKDEMEFIEVNLFLGGNYLPLIKGKWVGEKSNIFKKGMSIDFDEDGRTQTARQSIILASPKMRKKIYYEIIQSEDRAHNEAYELFPTDMASVEKRDETIVNNIKKSNELMKQYKKEIMKEYGLTEKQLSALALEGIRKRWPMP